MKKKNNSDKKGKKKKINYVDDGHTVYSMDGVDGPFWKRGKNDGVGLTRKERWAVIKAAFTTYLPAFLCVICCFAIAVILIGLWLG